MRLAASVVRDLRGCQARVLDGHQWTARCRLANSVISKLQEEDYIVRILPVSSLYFATNISPSHRVSQSRGSCVKNGGASAFQPSPSAHLPLRVDIFSICLLPLAVSHTTLHIESLSNQTFKFTSIRNHQYVGTGTHRECTYSNCGLWS